MFVGHDGRSAGDAPGVIGHGFVGEEGVVVVHVAVFGGDVELKAIGVDGVIREMLQHDFDCVCIFHQGQRVVVVALFVGKLDRLGEMVVERLQLAGHMETAWSGLATCSCNLVVAEEAAGELLHHIGFGDRERV